MDTFLRRAFARQFRALALLPVALLCAAAPAVADEPPLTLERAAERALQQQPLLEAQRAEVRAARERAVAMGQLPDPMLLAGVQNLPVTGADRYDLGAEPMTMASVGLMQQLPLPAKRRLRGEAGSLMADAGAARLAVLERSVRRDAALAWLALWNPEQAGALVSALAAEAERERGALDIAYRAGRAPQAEVLAAEVEVELLRDRERKLAQDAARARAQLGRWIGAGVPSALPGEAPVLAPPPPREALLAALGRHPELSEANFEAASARSGVALAREQFWPDWRIEAMYGWREQYDEMVTLQVGIDLPLFRGDRQGRELKAARARLEATEATRDDRLRQLRAQAEGTQAAWAEGEARLARYDQVIVPRAQARAEAALAAYRAGKSDLAAVIAARRAALEARLMQLDLRTEVLAQQLELQYLDATGE